LRSIATKTLLRQEWLVYAIPALFRWVWGITAITNLAPEHPLVIETMITQMQFQINPRPTIDRVVRAMERLFGTEHPTVQAYKE
jgi:hypothetical protein